MCQVGGEIVTLSIAVRLVPVHELSLVALTARLVGLPLQQPKGLFHRADFQQLRFSRYTPAGLSHVFSCDLPIEGMRADRIVYVPNVIGCSRLYLGMIIGYRLGFEVGSDRVRAVAGSEPGLFTQ